MTSLWEFANTRGLSDFLKGQNESVSANWSLFFFCRGVREKRLNEIFLYEQIRELNADMNWDYLERDFGKIVSLVKFLINLEFYYFNLVKFIKFGKITNFQLHNMMKINFRMLYPMKFNFIRPCENIWHRKKKFFHTKRFK